MNIRDLKVVFICPNHNEFYQKRCEHMKIMLKENGFKDVVHYKSSSESYPKCLSQAFIDVLSQYDEPILVLEDDVEFTNVDIFEFVIADAIYFGISKSAGHKHENKDDGMSLFENYSDTQVKVINMLATHAIFYITREYKNAVIQALQNDSHSHSDVVISRLQSRFKILANKNPSFYQSSKFNYSKHSENWTKFNIENVRT